MQFLTEKLLKSNTFRMLSMVVFTAVLCAFARPAGDYSIISTIPVEAEFMTTDFLNSAYVINQKNQVMKYDSTGNLVAVYSDNRFGQISSVDATSPFNVLMFYRDFGTLVTTDMKLSVRRLYKLSSVGISNIAAACLSHDNFIWVYDMDAAKLKKVNHNYEVIHESADMQQLLGDRIEPNFMLETGNLIYLNIPGMGIIMFDIYGTYYSSVSSVQLGKDDLDNFQVVNYKIVFFNDGNLNIYDLKTHELNVTPVPNTIKTKEVRVEKGRLFVLNEDELEFYALVK